MEMIIKAIKVEAVLHLMIIEVSIEVSPRGVLRKRCSENMEQIYSGTPMPKLQNNFIEIALRQVCSPVNLLHIFRIHFPKKTSDGLLLTEVSIDDVIKHLVILLMCW